MRLETTLATTYWRDHSVISRAANASGTRLSGSSNIVVPVYSIAVSCKQNTDSKMSSGRFSFGAKAAIAGTDRMVRLCSVVTLADPSVLAHESTLVSGLAPDPARRF